MVPTMSACTATKMARWEQLIAQGHDEIDVHSEFKSLTADIIAHTGFGSSYAEGKRVFELQREQQVLLHNAINLEAYIPGMRYILDHYVIHTLIRLKLILWKLTSIELFGKPTQIPSHCN